MSKSTESLAVAYSEHCDAQVSDGMKLLSLLKLPATNMKVLDLGCGTGQLSCMIADQLGDGGSVVAIDPDNERLKIAQETYSSVKNLVFQDGQAECIPGCDYDVVFSNYVFHWIKDKEKAFQSIHRSLKPSGVFAGTFITNLLDFPLNYISLLHTAQFNIFQSEVFYESSDAIEKIASSNGFRVEYREVTDVIVRFKNFEDFVQVTYAGFQGIVDPELMDAEKLQELRESVGNGLLEVPLLTLAYLLFEKNV